MNFSLPQTSSHRFVNYRTNTKTSWDNFYAREKKEMMDNDDFVGEIWFDENGAEEKMVDFLVEELNEEQLFNEKEQIKVLDIGTGNCHLLVS